MWATPASVILAGLKLTGFENRLPLENLSFHLQWYQITPKVKPPDEQGAFTNQL